MFLRKLLNIVLLVFSKSAFAEAEHRQSGLDRVEAEQRVAKKQMGYSVSFFYVAAIMGLGYLTAEVLNQHLTISWDVIRTARAVSVLIFGWSVLSRFGYETKTYKGETLLEITSQDAYKFFYLTGLYLVSVTLFLHGQ